MELCGRQINSMHCNQILGSSRQQENASTLHSLAVPCNALQGVAIALQFPRNALQRVALPLQFPCTSPAMPCNGHSMAMPCNHFRLAESQNSIAMVCKSLQSRWIPNTLAMHCILLRPNEIQNLLATFNPLLWLTNDTLFENSLFTRNLNRLLVHLCGLRPPAKIWREIDIECLCTSVGLGWHSAKKKS